MNLDPSSAALYAGIAVALICLGAVLTAGVLSTQERATVMGGIVAVLIGVYYLGHRRRNGGE